MKKVFAVLLSIAVLMGAFSTAAFAQAPAEPTEAVTVDWERSGFDHQDGSDCYFNLYLTVNEAASGDLEVVFSDAVIEMLNDAGANDVLPGFTMFVDVYVENASGHVYAYQSGSLDVSTPDVSGESNLSPFTGFDGQLLPYSRFGAISLTHPAIMQLYNVRGSSDITADMLFSIYDELEKAGYTGESALSNYMLDYYRETDGVQYADWDDLKAQNPDISNRFAVAGSNGIRKMTVGKLKELCAAHPEIDPYVYVTGDTSSDSNVVDVQVKWPEEELASLSYDIFYQDMLGTAFGEECAQMNPNRNTAFTRTRGIGDYMDHTSELYQSADAYFAALDNADRLEPGETLAFNTVLTMDGPGVGNQYQNYNFAYYHAISLSQIDTSYTVEHRYYTSTDGAAYELDGVVESEAISGTVGDVISADQIEKLETYEGNRYNLVSDSGDLTLVLDAEQNRIVLEYYREVETPVTPGENPDTGDGNGLLAAGMLMFLAAAAAGTAVWMRGRKRMRGE